MLVSRFSKENAICFYTIKHLIILLIITYIKYPIYLPVNQLKMKFKLIYLLLETTFVITDYRSSRIIMARQILPKYNVVVSRLIYLKC